MAPPEHDQPLLASRDFLEIIRVLIVAGIPTGVVVAGLGSRLAMLLLRVTSPDRVRGVTSDDGFTIGDVTLGGTYNLMLIGAAAGIIGAGAYQAVAPWLLGPGWFRRMTVALASGAVVGSILVRSDGVDFTLLKPAWLAVGIFVALPAAFGLAISAAVESVKARGSWTRRGRQRWLLPITSVVLFPLSVFPLVVATVIAGVWFAVRSTGAWQALPTNVGLRVVGRGVLLFIALMGLGALVNDISRLADTGAF